MPTGEPARKVFLDPAANTPVLIQKILDVTTLDDLRLMLNGERDKLRIRCLYLEIKRRENLMSVQN